MNNTRWIWVLLVIVSLVGLVAAGEGHKCSADTQTCLNKMATSLKERGWVGIEMEQDEQNGQLKVTRVVPESPAMESGLQVGDVLVAMNGLEFNEANKEKMYSARKEMTVGKEISYTVDRPGCCHKKGGKTDVELTLAELPADVMAQWIGQHMIEHAAIEIAQH